MAESSGSEEKSSKSVKRELSESDGLDDLLSMEKLDRASPELWPEKRVNNFVAMNTPPIITSPPSWVRGLSQEDINAMHQLGALSSTGLIAEIRKLYDEAYKLGIQEAKEMTRGRHLNIFANPTGSKKK